MFTEVAANKQINYTISIDKDLPKNVFTDKVRVEQVLKNLLSNAFKFTPEKGSIAINVIPGKHAKTVSFCIKDTGIGIPLDKQKVSLNNIGRGIISVSLFTQPLCTAARRILDKMKGSLNKSLAARR